jgi:hypothetical protein
MFMAAWYRLLQPLLPGPGKIIRTGERKPRPLEKNQDSNKFHQEKEHFFAIGLQIKSFS